MTGYPSKKKAAQDKLKCQCSMTTKLVGSGCQYCNPEYMDDDDAQPAQEPVGFVDSKLNPIQRPWVELTKDDTFEIAERLGLADVAWLDLMVAIEAKLKEKNNG